MNPPQQQNETGNKPTFQFNPQSNDAMAVNVYRQAPAQHRGVGNFFSQSKPLKKPQQTKMFAIAAAPLPSPHPSPSWTPQQRKVSSQFGSRQPHDQPPQAGNFGSPMSHSQSNARGNLFGKIPSFEEAERIVDSYQTPYETQGVQSIEMHQISMETTQKPVSELKSGNLPGSAKSPSGKDQRSI